MWGEDEENVLHTPTPGYCSEPQGPASFIYLFIHSFIQSTILPKHLARWGIKFDIHFQDFGH